MESFHRETSCMNRFTIPHQDLVSTHHVIKKHNQKHITKKKHITKFKDSYTFTDDNNTLVFNTNAISADPDFKNEFHVTTKFNESSDFSYSTKFNLFVNDMQSSLS